MKLSPFFRESNLRPCFWLHGANWLHLKSNLNDMVIPLYMKSNLRTFLLIAWKLCKVYSHTFYYIFLVNIRIIVNYMNKGRVENIARLNRTCWIKQVAYLWYQYDPALVAKNLWSKKNKKKQLQILYQLTYIAK